MNTERLKPESTQIPTTAGAPWWRILTAWTRQETTLLMREPMAVFFSMLFPVIMYVFIGIPYGSTDIGNGRRYIDTMFSALIISVMANLLLMGLPIYLAELRTKGVARRYASLPLPGGIFLSAVLLSTITLVITASAIIITVVAIRDGVLPQLWDPRYLTLVLGSLIWVSAMGFFIGTLPISSRTTQALSAVVFFTMFFGSGAAVPLEGLPEILQRVMDWNPLKQWLDVMVNSYIGAQTTTTQYLRLLAAIPLTILCAYLGQRMWKTQR